MASIINTEYALKPSFIKSLFVQKHVEKVY